MTAPLKPWERAGVNSRAFSGDFGNVITPTVNMNGGGVPAATGLNAPPLPPRPIAASIPASTGIGGYSTYRPGFSSPSGYGGYGGGSYGGYTGGYGGYSNYGGFNSYGGYNPQGYGAGPVNRVEESSHQAFQSIGTIVHAFGSISMMLDSTLNAVYSSFQAIIGMANQFSRLRSHLSQVFSALTIFRRFKWAYYKLLSFLGLKRELPNNLAWNSALTHAGVMTEADLKKPRSSWPIALYMAIIVSAPYLLWKIVSSIEETTVDNDKRWASGEGEHYTAQADYDFKASSEQEISFQSGQTLRLAPRSLQPRVKGWLLASIDGNKTGLIPANYVRIMSKEDKVSQQ